MRFELLSAFQALALPERAYGVTHEDARMTIAGMCGVYISEGVTVPAGLSLDGYIAWLKAAYAEKCADA